MEATNLSKMNREKMLNTISEIKSKITDEETLNNLSLIENELNNKKYGLIWEEHQESVDEYLIDKIPTFEEIKSKSIISNEKEQYNFLLEGDNLHSLYLLEKTHKNKIDFIYIDPPYNTENREFIYNDNLFQQLLEEGNTYKDLVQIVHYIVPRVIDRKFKDEDGNFITNKFGYFKSSIIGNINRLNLNLDDLWGEYEEEMER